MYNDKLTKKILNLIKQVDHDNNKLQKIYDFLIKEVNNVNIINNEEWHPIPETYNELVSYISDKIDNGLICYLNLDTKECVEISYKEIKETDDYQNFLHKVKKWKNKVAFEPLSEYTTLEIMNNFTNTIRDKNIKTRLHKALSQRTPINNFLHVINKTLLKQNWLKFRKMSIKQHVFQQIEHSYANI